MRAGSDRALGQVAEHALVVVDEGLGVRASRCRPRTRASASSRAASCQGAANRFPDPAHTLGVAVDDRRSPRGRAVAPRRPWSAGWISFAGGLDVVGRPWGFPSWTSRIMSTLLGRGRPAVRRARGGRGADHVRLADDADEVGDMTATHAFDVIRVDRLSGDRRQVSSSSPDSFSPSVCMQTATSNASACRERRVDDPHREAPQSSWISRPIGAGIRSSRSRANPGSRCGRRPEVPRLIGKRSNASKRRSHAATPVPRSPAVIKVVTPADSATGGPGAGLSR